MLVNFQVVISLPFWLSPKNMVLYVVSFKSNNIIAFVSENTNIVTPAPCTGKTSQWLITTAMHSHSPLTRWHIQAPFCPSVSCLPGFFLSFLFCKAWVIWNGQKPDRGEERKTSAERKREVITKETTLHLINSGIKATSITTGKRKRYGGTQVSLTIANQSIRNNTHHYCQNDTIFTRRINERERAGRIVNCLGISHCPY